MVTNMTKNTHGMERYIDLHPSLHRSKPLHVGHHLDQGLQLVHRSPVGVKVNKH